MKLSPIYWSTKPRCAYFYVERANGERRYFRFKTLQQAKAARKQHIRTIKEIVKVQERIQEIKRLMEEEK